jgi:hypothetical protein
MASILVLASVVLMGLGIYLEVRYALQNYPRSRKWRAALFAVSFSAGALFASAAAVSGGGLGVEKTVLYVLSVGLGFGLASAFLSPHGLQYVIPKRRPPSGS